MELTRMLKVNCKDKVVLVRVDYNVPIKHGEVLEDSRIRKTLPTIAHLLDKEAKQIILVSHLGRPKGKDAKYSLEPVYNKLVELLPDEQIGFAKDCITTSLPTKKIVLLENTRFYDEEMKNDAAFAKQLAHNANVFIFDAFGTAHRAHASTVGITKHIAKSCIGLLVEHELKVFSLEDIPRPFKAVLGSAKVKDKIPVLENLLPKVDKMLLGGAIVFTFLRALGYETGKSLVEVESIPDAKKMLELYKDKIVLPIDIVVSDDEDGGEVHTVDVENIPKHMKGLDIGDQSIVLFEESLDKAGTIFWNGPLGLYEIPPFDHATNEIAQYLAKSKAITIIGGGDTEEAIHRAGIVPTFTHLSTGGGAALEFIAGHPLVALENLRTDK